MRFWMITTVTVVYWLLTLTDTSAQTYTYRTNAYDYLSGSLYSDEVAEDVTVYTPVLGKGYSGTFFSAGEYAKDEDGQGIYMATFTNNGALLKTASYNDNNYREYVKKVVATNKSLYLIANAVNISTGNSVLMVLRYNTRLEFRTKRIFTAYDAPADAVSAVVNLNVNRDEIYIACSKKDNTKSALALLNLDSNLNVIHNVLYNYTGGEDVYEEQAVDLDIAYDQSIGQTIYVAGAVSGPTGYAANVLMKLNGSLSMAWTKTGYPNLGYFNSVKQAGAPYYDVYVCGNTQNNGNMKWRIISVDPFTGAVKDSAKLGKPDYQVNALKITDVTETAVIVAGNDQSSALNKFDIIIAQYDRSLQNAIYNFTELPNGSVLNDAVQDKTATWVTGAKKSGTDQYAFVYKIESATGLMLYENQVKNSKASLNRISLLGGGPAHPDSSNIAVAGFRNNSATVFQPDDLVFLTRIYTPHFTANKTNDAVTATGSFLRQNSPNPVINTTTIQYSVPEKCSSAKIIVANRNGIIIKQIDIHKEGSGSVALDRSGFLPGLYQYFLYVDGKLIDSKEMMIMQ